MPEKSRLMPISYYNPKQAIRLSAYADTIVLEPDGREQRLRAIRFGGYPEMVRAMSDAIYAGATLETEFAGKTAMLTCEPKKYAAISPPMSADSSIEYCIAAPPFAHPRIITQNRQLGKSICMRLIALQESKKLEPQHRLRPLQNRSFSL